jgi:hypothetical protein
MKRELSIGSKRFTVVQSMDEPSLENKACHRYEVSSTKVPKVIYAQVDFQNGPVQEFGVNGCHNEDLIAIVIDRLQGFQSGHFRCRENAIAITKLEEALLWLNYRTSKRQSMGVEGTNVNHE